MKKAIKTVTFTLDELRNMLDVTLESGDTRAANQVIRRKLSEKAERFARQREQRRLRAEQKKAAIKESENSALSVSSKKNRKFRLHQQADNLPQPRTRHLHSLDQQSSHSFEKQYPLSHK